MSSFFQNGRWRVDLQDIDSALMHGAFWALGVNASGMLLGFLTQAILAKTLGVHGYGLYLTVLGWSNVAGLVCALEFANASVRYVSAYTAEGNWGALRGFLRRSHQIVGGTTVAVGVTGALVLLIVRSPDNEAKDLAFLVGCALFPLTSLVQLQAGCLLGWKRIRHSQGPFQIARPAIFAVGLLLVSRMMGANFEAAHAVMVQFVATGIALLATAWYLRQLTPVKAVSIEPVYHTREWIQTSLHFVAISMAQLVLSTQADVLFVSALLGTTQAGLYGGASQFATLVGFGSTAIMMIAQPMIADLYARGRYTELGKLSRNVVMLTLVASLPVFIVVVLSGRWLLHFYRPEFTAAYPVLVVLAVSQLASAVVGGLLGYLFTMTSHQEIATKIIGGTAVLNLVLAPILTMRYGMIGTASATVIATLVRSVALALAGRNILKRMRAEAQAAAA
ncbi:MAG: oligosaccharide flippase family protein [Gemmatimonadaceae bacterium]